MSLTKAQLVVLQCIMSLTKTCEVGGTPLHMSLITKTTTSNSHKDIVGGATLHMYVSYEDTWSWRYNIRTSLRDAHLRHLQNTPVPEIGWRWSSCVVDTQNIWINYRLKMISFSYQVNFFFKDSLNWFPAHWQLINVCMTLQVQRCRRGGVVFFISWVLCVYLAALTIIQVVNINLRHIEIMMQLTPFNLATLMTNWSVRIRGVSSFQEWICII